MSATCYQPFVSGPVKYAPVSVSASGDNTIVAAVATKKIRLLSGLLVAAGTVNVKWKSAAATDLTGAMSMLNAARIEHSATPWGQFETAAGEALVLNLSAAIGVAGWITYLEVPTSTS